MKERIKNRTKLWTSLTSPLDTNKPRIATDGSIAICAYSLTGNIQHSRNVTLTQPDFLAYKSPLLRKCCYKMCEWVDEFSFSYFLLLFPSTFYKFLRGSGGMTRLTLGAWLAPPTRGLRGSQTARGRFRWPGAGGAEHRNGPSELSIRAACISDHHKKKKKKIHTQNERKIGRIHYIRWKLNFSICLPQWIRH